MNMASGRVMEYGARDGRDIFVGIGDVQVSGERGATLVASGIGSCVCVCLHDPIAGVGGMAHVLLPGDRMMERYPNDTRFAKFALPTLVEKMKAEGAIERRLVSGIAGGACVLRTSLDSFQEIGGRNVLMVTKILEDMKVRTAGVDIGGKEGRTVRFDVKKGHVYVYSSRHRNGKQCMGK